MESDLQFCDLSRASWDKTGEAWIFRVPLKNMSTCFHLGKVKKDKSGRYVWFRLKPHTWQELRDGPCQGVAKTLEEAQRLATCDITEQ